MFYRPWLPEELAFASWLEPAAPRFGSEPRGSLWLIGELLQTPPTPVAGFVHHHPSVGLHHHCHTVDEVGGRGDARLKHHGRGPCCEAELARLTMALMTRACGQGMGSACYRPRGLTSRIDEILLSFMPWSFTCR